MSGDPNSVISQVRTSEAQGHAPSREPALAQAILTAILRHFSIIAALAFLVSALANEWAFRVNIGISYLSVASTSDVVLGGILAVPIFVFVGIILVGGGLLTLRFTNPILTKLSGSNMTVRELFLDARGAGLLLPVAVCVIFLIQTFISVAAQMRFISEIMTGKDEYLLGDRVPDNCRYPTVQWSGANATIVRCTDAKPPGRIFVFRNPQDVRTTSSYKDATEDDNRRNDRWNVKQMDAAKRGIILEVP